MLYRTARTRQHPKLPHAERSCALFQTLQAEKQQRLFVTMETVFLPHCRAASLWLPHKKVLTTRLIQNKVRTTNNIYIASLPNSPNPPTHPNVSQLIRNGATAAEPNRVQTAVRMRTSCSFDKPLAVKTHTPGEKIEQRGSVSSHPNRDQSMELLFLF